MLPENKPPKVSEMYHFDVMATVHGVLGLSEDFSIGGQNIFHA
jgi:hypothetical protein